MIAKKKNRKTNIQAEEQILSLYVLLLRSEFEGELKSRIVSENEPNITLFLEHFIFSIDNAGWLIIFMFHVFQAPLSSEMNF